MIKSMQSRKIAVCDRPVFCANSRVIQSVLLARIEFSVCAMTAWTCVSVMVRGAPGRSSSGRTFQTLTRNCSRYFSSRGFGEVRFLRNRGITQSFSAVQHDAELHGHGLGGFRPTRQRLQILRFVSRDIEGFGGMARYHKSLIFGTRMLNINALATIISFTISESM